MKSFTIIAIVAIKLSDKYAMWAHKPDPRNPLHLSCVGIVLPPKLGYNAYSYVNNYLTCLSGYKFYI